MFETSNAEKQQQENIDSSQTKPTSSHLSTASKVPEVVKSSMFETSNAEKQHQENIGSSQLRYELLKINAEIVQELKSSMETKIVQEMKSLIETKTSQELKSSIETEIKMLKRNKIKSVKDEM